VHPSAKVRNSGSIGRYADPDVLKTTFAAIAIGDGLIFVVQHLATSGLEITDKLPFPHNRQAMRSPPDP
jgi:hypothetical protein